MNRQTPARSVNACVDGVFVLTVRSFAERIAHIEAEMVRHGIQFEFMFEHDADQLDDALIEATFAPSDMRRPHHSLVLKNIAVWQQALARGWRHVLVFEDDAVLDPEFTARFIEAMQAAERLEPGWLLFLGGHDTKVPDSYFLAPGPLIELPIATAEGYVCDAESMRRRLQWLDSHRVHLAFDHQVRHIDQQTGTRQYWLTRPVVQQGSVLGLFGSKLDGTRNKHSVLYNRARNRWNKFQRHTLRRFIVRTRAALGLHKS